MEKKKGKYGTRLVLIICIAVFITALGFFIFGNMKIQAGKKIIRDGKKAYAQVIEFEKNEKGVYIPMIYYTADEQAFYVLHPELKKNYYIGEEINAYYYSGSPEYIFVENSAFEKSAYYGGMIVMIMSIIVCAWYYLPKIRVAKIIENGKWGMFKVTKVEKLVFNRKRVHCSSKGVAKRKNNPFVSKKVRFDLPKDIKNSTLTVYYLEKHPSIYYVDIDKINYNNK